ncbi:MAG: chemotaxis protein CheB [Proteobacteria bacterium]|nr:chemotaxis protein CheB [Pseudomonadota bacterium]MBU1737912.1 chemotaxis protein CheB [Pseudomonadota bacterium]
MIRGQYKIVVIGVSFGGLTALSTLLKPLPAAFPVPLLIVQHTSPDADAFLPAHLNKLSRLQVKEAEPGELARPGTVYLAPPNYHLLLEDDLSLSLSADERINYSRPSIDVLFESAAHSCGKEVIGIILTGANNDGSRGLRTIQVCGGLTIVQDPDSAEAAMMPRAALDACRVDHLLPLPEIAPFLIGLICGKT